MRSAVFCCVCSDVFWGVSEVFWVVQDVFWGVLRRSGGVLRCSKNGLWCSGGVLLWSGGVLRCSWDVLRCPSLLVARSTPERLFAPFPSFPCFPFPFPSILKQLWIAQYSMCTLRRWKMVASSPSRKMQRNCVRCYCVHSSVLLVWADHCCNSSHSSAIRSLGIPGPALLKSVECRA